MGKAAVWEIRGRTEIGRRENYRRRDQSQSISLSSFFPLSLSSSLTRCCSDFFLCIALSSFIRRRNEIRRKPRAARPLELVDFSWGLRVDDAVEIVPLPSHLGPHRALRFRMLSPRLLRRCLMSSVCLGDTRTICTPGKFSFCCRCWLYNASCACAGSIAQWMRGFISRKSCAFQRQKINHSLWIRITFQSVYVCSKDISPDSSNTREKRFHICSCIKTFM